ncbi:MAG TPA: hypothetical protein VMR96_07350 [Solirubrobacterales bacterium]|nr:hypothetical protein [Solirubrobacterales bacterium]
MDKTKSSDQTTPLVAWAFLSSFLPYPDPMRRRRVRQQARQLIRCDPWPGDDATPFDIAQLALLKLLWLQEETHRVANRRQGDAAALLARTSTETCLAGLYWLHGDAQVDRMRGHNAQSLRHLLSPMADGDPISPSLLKDVASAIGKEARLPTLNEMANVVVDKTGRSFARDIYEGLYKPLSIAVAHPTGLALLRHVDSDDRLKDTPTPAWTVRSARHTADACMAVLALAIAEHFKSRGKDLLKYANAHLNRTITPVAVISGRAALESFQPSKLVPAVRSSIELRRYLFSEGAAADSHMERKVKAEQAIGEILRVFGGGESPPHEVFVDYFADQLALIPDEEQQSEPM